MDDYVAFLCLSCMEFLFYAKCAESKDIGLAKFFHLRKTTGCLNFKNLLELCLVWECVSECYFAEVSRKLLKSTKLELVTLLISGIIKQKKLFKKSSSLYSRMNACQELQMRLILLILQQYVLVFV